MIRHITEFPCMITVFQQTEKDDYNDDLMRCENPSPFRVDFKYKITQFHSSDLELDEITDVRQLKPHLESQLAGGHGTYYLFVRDILVQKVSGIRISRRTKKKKQRRGRKEFDREKLRKLGIHKRPRQRRMQVWNCILKVDMFEGEVTKIHEKKPRKKRRPYGRNDYALIKLIKMNKKKAKIEDY